MDPELVAERAAKCNQSKFAYSLMNGKIEHLRTACACAFASRKPKLGTRRIASVPTTAASFLPEWKHQSGMVAARAGIGSGHLQVGWPGLLAVTAEYHTFGCVGTCVIFAWSLVGVLRVSGKKSAEIVRVASPLMLLPRFAAARTYDNAKPCDILHSLRFLMRL
eukprot:719010-Pleurochrysis_carterae.AAC.1